MDRAWQVSRWRMWAETFRSSGEIIASLHGGQPDFCSLLTTQPVLHMFGPGHRLADFRVCVGGLGVSGYVRLTLNVRTRQRARGYSWACGNDVRVDPGFGTFAMIRLMKNFFRNQSGNFATMMAIMALPMLTAVGAAVDYSYALNIRNKIQVAADAAVVAAAKQYLLTGKSDARKIGRRFLLANTDVEYKVSRRLRQNDQ